MLQYTKYFTNTFAPNFSISKSKQINSTEVHQYDLNGNLLYVNATSGICHDICLHEGRLYTAEGDMGVACYDVTETLTERSRVADIGCVRQIVEAGTSLVIQIGC